MERKYLGLEEEIIYQKFGRGDQVRELVIWGISQRKGLNFSPWLEAGSGKRRPLLWALEHWEKTEAAPPPKATGCPLEFGSRSWIWPLSLVLATERTH